MTTSIPDLKIALEQCANSARMLRDTLAGLEHARGVDLVALRLAQRRLELTVAALSYIPQQLTQ